MNDTSYVIADIWGKMDSMDSMDDEDVSKTFEPQLYF